MGAQGTTSGAVVHRAWVIPAAAAPSWAAIGATWLVDRSLWTLTLPAGALLLLAVGAGVSAPALGLFHPAICRAPEGSGRVALTFDDGPDPDHTPRILDALERHGARGTFFLVGERVRRHPEVARAIVERGHEVAHHSDSHGLWLSFPPQRRLGRDFDLASAAIEEATGLRPRLFRPPVGLMNPRIAWELRRRGMVVVAWSVRPRDGGHRSPDGVARHVIARLRDGGIVLLHDGRSPHLRDHVPPAVEALPRILDHVAERGWRAVTVSELTGEPAYLPGARRSAA